MLDKLEINDSMIPKDSFPTDVIPNYLALRAILELKQDFNSQASKVASASFLEAHKQYNLLDEAGLFNAKYLYR